MLIKGPKPNLIFLPKLRCSKVKVRQICSYFIGSYIYLTYDGIQDMVIRNGQIFAQGRSCERVRVRVRVRVRGREREREAFGHFWGQFRWAQGPKMGADGNWAVFLYMRHLHTDRGTETDGRTRTDGHLGAPSTAQPVQLSNKLHHRGMQPDTAVRAPTQWVTKEHLQCYLTEVCAVTCENVVGTTLFYHFIHPGLNPSQLDPDQRAHLLLRAQPAAPRHLQPQQRCYFLAVGESRPLRAHLKRRRRLKTS